MFCFVYYEGDYRDCLGIKTLHFIGHYITEQTVGGSTGFSVFRISWKVSKCVLSPLKLVTANSYRLPLL